MEATSTIVKFGRKLVAPINYYKLYTFIWADPGGTAMPGRPATGVERAPNIPSISKNQFNILVPLCGNFQILS